MSKKSVQSTVLGALLAAALPAAASAGSYHVYSCRTPAGASAPADGWSGSKVGTYTYAEDTCSTGGALVAGLGDQPARTANTDSATWAFAASASTRIAAATLWRAGDAAGGAAVNATYQFWLAAPSEASIFDECLAALGCTQQGNETIPLAPENEVLLPASDTGGHLYAIASCGGVAEYKCKEHQGDANNFAAVVYLYAADITLEQAAGPSASGVSGELASAPSVSGTSDVAFSATDPGAGIYQAVFTVDGQVVQSTVVNDDGGRCRNVGGTTDGLPAFLYVQPCLPSVSADVGLDTTRLSNGVHHLLVTVTDAAGNSAPVLDRDITVANPAGPQPGPGSQAGAPNGTNASSQAMLTLAWHGVRGPRLTTAFGRSELATGRLSAPGGLPIAGATIELAATPASVGARTIPLASVTTAADGSFSVPIAPGASSRVLSVAYRAHLGDPAPAANARLELVVRAGVSLAVHPRISGVGRRIFFSGRLRGGPVPPSGKLLVLEARSGHGAWLEFEVVRSDRRGRWHASYRFRFPGPATYQFRVVANAEGDYPYATGASPVRKVYER